MARHSKRSLETNNRQTEASNEDPQNNIPRWTTNSEIATQEHSGQERRGPEMEFAQGQGLLSLVFTLLIVYLLALNSKLHKHGFLILIIIILSGILYHLFTDNASCSSDRESLKLKLKQLEAKAEKEKRILEERLQVMQKKFKDLGRTVTETFDQVLSELKLEVTGNTSIATNSTSMDIFQMKQKSVNNNKA